MVSMETAVVIACEPTIAFALHSDFCKRPLWHDHVLSSEMLTEEPLGVGSRFHTRNKTGGFTVTTREQITTYEPPNFYCYEMDSGPFHFKSCQRFTAVAAGTQYQLRVEMTARNWLGKILLPFISRQQRPHFEEAAQELKRYIENQSSSLSQAVSTT